MSLLDLNEIEILQGFLNLFYVLLVVILGSKIISKFFEYKRKELLTIGLSLIFGLGAPWFPGAISFVTYVLFDYTLEPFLYFFLNTIFITPGLVSWIYSFCHIAYPHLKKKIIPIFLLICIIWEIIYIILLIIDPAIIGEIEGKFDADYNLFAIAFILFALMSVLITTTIFALQSIRSNDPKIKMEGRFLLIAVFTFAFGAISEAIYQSPVIVILIRVLLISSAIEYYIAWLMPKRIENWLIKYDQVKGEASKEKKDHFQDVLKILSHRREITEEELTFYRDRRLCIVCRVEVGGFLYMCTKCNVLYCGECAAALTQLENACWVCNEAIDKTKPSLPYKEEKLTEFDVKKKKE